MLDNWWALSRGNRENEESYGPMGSGQLVDRQGLGTLYFQLDEVVSNRWAWMAFSARAGENR